MLRLTWLFQPHNSHVCSNQTTHTFSQINKQTHKKAQQIPNYEVQWKTVRFTKARSSHRRSISSGNKTLAEVTFQSELWGQVVGAGLGLPIHHPGWNEDYSNIDFGLLMLAKVFLRVIFGEFLVFFFFCGAVSFFFVVAPACGC